MTTKELISKLKELPEDREVVVSLDDEDSLLDDFGVFFIDADLLSAEKSESYNINVIYGKVIGFSAADELSKSLHKK